MLHKIVLVVLLLMAAVSICSAQTDSKNLSTTIQPSKFIDGRSISFSSGVYTIPNGQWAKAVELGWETDSGYVEVHLVKQSATSWYRMPVYPGMRNSALFDKIRQSGTTIDVAKLAVFLNE